jgi:hypothetical protein
LSFFSGKQHIFERVIATADFGFQLVLAKVFVSNYQSTNDGIDIDTSTLTHRHQNKQAASRPTEDREGESIPEFRLRSRFTSVSCLLLVAGRSFAKLASFQSNGSHVLYVL